MKKILPIAFFSLFAVYCSAQPWISFDSLSTGMTGKGACVLSLAIKDNINTNSVFAGGHFKIAGRDTATNIAEWVAYQNNNEPQIGKWVALGTGVDSDVCALAVLNNSLYAGGKFDSAGGVAASHIAVWDTVVHKWDSLLGQLNGNVYALCVYNNALYVGGDFTIVNGDTVDRIAEWKNNAWFPVGKGFDTGAVYTLTLSNDTLYAGGSFLKSNGRTLNHIAKLSGANWAPLGSGTDNTVYALGDYNRSLFAGGAFAKTGGLQSHYFSSYEDYSSWRWIPQDGFVNDTVRALGAGSFPLSLVQQHKNPASMGDCLLVGGNFDSANGLPDKYFTIYNFGDIDSFARLSGPVYAVASSGGFNVPNFIGGEFDTVKYDYKNKEETLNNVAVLRFDNLSGGISTITNKSNVVVYPNPSSGVFTLQIVNGKLSMLNKEVEVYNVLGERVLSQTICSAQGDNSINLGNQSNGVYLYRVLSHDGNIIGQGKLVIQK